MTLRCEGGIDELAKSASVACGHFPKPLVASNNFDDDRDSCSDHLITPKHKTYLLAKSPSVGFLRCSLSSQMRGLEDLGFFF